VVKLYLLLASQTLFASDIIDIDRADVSGRCFGYIWCPSGENSLAFSTSSYFITNDKKTKGEEITCDSQTVCLPPGHDIQLSIKAQQSKQPSLKHAAQ